MPIFEDMFFLDAAYIRRVHSDLLRDVFRVSGGELDFSKIAVADRSYVYDCEGPQQGKDEKPEDYEARRRSQDVMLRAIEQLDHVQLRVGRLKKSRGVLRQKEVDVALAVDLVLSAERRLARRLHVFAGDGDFRPAVQATVQIGVPVHLHAHRRSTSQDLVAASDVFHALDSVTVAGWSDEETAARLSRIHTSRTFESRGDKGTLGAHAVYAFELDGERYLRLGETNYSCDDFNVLKRALEYDYCATLKLPPGW